MALDEKTKLRCDQLNKHFGLKFDFSENAYIGDIGSKHFYVPALDITTYTEESWDNLLKSMTDASIVSKKSKKFTDVDNNKVGEIGIGDTAKTLEDVVEPETERRIPLNINSQRRNKFMKLRFGTKITECSKCGREMVYSCSCDWDPKESDYDWSEFITERHFVLMNSRKRFSKDNSIEHSVVELPFWNESDFSREIISIDGELLFNAHELMKGYPTSVITIDPDKQSLRVVCDYPTDDKVKRELSTKYFKISKNTIIHE